MAVTGNRGAGSALTGLSEATTVVGLCKTVEDNGGGGGDNPGKEEADVAVVVVKHSALVNEATGVLVKTAEMRGNTVSTFGRADIMEDPPAGLTRLADCKDGNVGLGPVKLAVVTLQVVDRIGEAIAGVHATKGELIAGTLGSLVEVWRTTGAWQPTVAWFTRGKPSVAPVVVLLVLGTCGA